MSTTSLKKQPTFFIKIKHNGALRKVQVPSHPAPEWSKLASAIISRFGIPADQPIGLQYRDSDFDLVTISSQVELDELWDEIKLSAQPRQKDGSNQQLIYFILVLVNDFRATSISESNAGTNDLSATPFAETGPDQRVIVESPHTHVDQVPDPADYPIVDSASPEPPSTLTSKINKFCTALEQADLITPQLQSTVGSYAQMIAQFAGMLNSTCSTVADRFQAPPSEVSKVTSPPEPNPAVLAHAIQEESLLDNSISSMNDMAFEVSPPPSPRVRVTFQPSSSPTYLSRCSSPLFDELDVPECSPVPLSGWGARLSSGTPVGLHTPRRG